MYEITLCPECKFPEQLNQRLEWLDSGVLVSKWDPTHRIRFFESENLDPLFHGIENIIQNPIEHIIIAAKRNASRDFLKKLITAELKEEFRAGKIGVEPFIDLITTNGILFGLGAQAVLDVRVEWDEKDFLEMRVSEPFSLPLYCGETAGSCEAVTDRSFEVEYVQESPEVYTVRAHVSDRSVDLQDRMSFDHYHYKQGDIELERCATCGSPKALSGCRWLLDRGIIVNQSNKRRMAFGGTGIEETFRELEEELGDTIPSVVVEAQRRFVRTGFYTIEEISDEGDLRTQLAVRGLGNLREIKMDSHGVQLRIDNVTMHLMIVGLIQGLYELTFAVDSSVDWELTDDGNLSLEVKPT